MPSIPTRRQQPSPVSPQVPIPNEFPAIPKEVLDRFPSAKDWQTRLNEFWGRTAQALQESQRQTAAQVNSQVIWTVDRFLVYTTNGGAMPMFALDDTGIRLGNVLVINTPGRKVYIGAGVYADDSTPFYIDTLGFFSLGASLTWDPDADTLTITGIINATSGTIGGFDIGSDYIRDSANSFGLASTVTAGDDVRFWAGATFANRATAPVRIFESGTLFLKYIESEYVGINGTLSGTSDDNGLVVFGSFHVGCARLIATLDTEANGDVVYGAFVLPTIDKNAFTGLTAYGIYSSLPLSAGTGTIDNAYGLYIDTVNIGTNNYGVYVATTAPNYMAGDLTAASIGATTPGSGAFTTLSATGKVTLTGGNAGSAGSPAMQVANDRVIAFVDSSGSNTMWIYGGSDDAVHIGAGSADKLVVSGTGLKVPSLAGTGTRTVVADANGVLSAP